MKATEKQKAHYIALTDCNDKKRLIEQQIETKLDLEADITDWVRAKCIQICACISVPCISYRMIHFYFAHTSLQIPSSLSNHYTSPSQIHLHSFISFILSRYTLRFDLIYSVYCLFSSFFLISSILSNPITVCIEPYLNTAAPNAEQLSQLAMT